MTFGIARYDVPLLLILGVLLFAPKWPEMVKYLCNGIVEFWKDLRGFEDEIDSSSAALEASKLAQRVAMTAPKFEANAGAITTPPGVQQAPPKI